MKKRKKQRRGKTLKYTTDSRVYKMTKRKTILKCDYCPPNKGCNSRWRRGQSKSWKRYRKTQWK